MIDALIFHVLMYSVSSVVSDCLTDSCTLQVSILCYIINISYYIPTLNELVHKEGREVHPHNVILVHFW